MLSALLVGIFIIAAPSHSSAGIIISHYIDHDSMSPEQKDPFGTIKYAKSSARKISLNAEPVINVLMKLEVNLSITLEISILLRFHHLFSLD